MITIYTKNEPNISSRKFAFKITSRRKGNAPTEVRMVTTCDDYEDLISSHEFNPLLFIVPFHHRLAYLYGCCNFDLHTPRNETFTFWYRKIGTNEWKKWFQVSPYTENIYGSISGI